MMMIFFSFEKGKLIMKMVEGKSITTANKYEETVKCKKLKKKKKHKNEQWRYLFAVKVCYCWLRKLERKFFFTFKRMVHYENCLWCDNSCCDL